MSTITKPYTFATGQTILASQANSDFDTIYNDFNGNITNANIASAAAIAGSKLANASIAMTTKLTGNVGFFGYRATSDQAIVKNTETVVNLNAEIFDTNAWFASAKFTPQLAGTYLFIAQVAFDSVDDAVLCYIKIAKNGTGISRSQLRQGGAGTIVLNSQVFGIANGTTDYFEVLAYHNSAADTTLLNGTSLTFMQGVLLNGI